MFWLTRLADVHVDVVADTMRELAVQELLDGEFAPVPSDRVLGLAGIGVDRPAIGAPARQTEERKQRQQQSHLDIVDRGSKRRVPSSLCVPPRP